MGVREELQELAESLQDLPPQGPDKPREEWTDRERAVWAVQILEWQGRHGIGQKPAEPGHLWIEIAREAYEKQQREGGR